MLDKDDDMDLDDTGIDEEDLGLAADLDDPYDLDDEDIGDVKTSHAYPMWGYSCPYCGHEDDDMTLSDGDFITRGTRHICSAVTCQNCDEVFDVEHD